MDQPDPNESFSRKHAVLLGGGDHSARLITALLEEMEFGSITSVPDGESLLNIIGNRAPDLVVVDLDATEGGGKIVNAALEAAPDLPLVVVSSYATIEESVELMKSGARDVIRKPLDLATVKNKIIGIMKSCKVRTDQEASLCVGPYTIIKEIERGGMGIIYKANDNATGQLVALKVLKTGRNAPIEQVLRFHREASAISKLVHPYIVSIMNTGFSGDDYFIAMEFIDGKSLDEAVYENKINALQTVDIIIKVLDAVRYAHEMNVIHRDLKPPNILLDKDFNPHIIDFGLATYVKGNIRLTRTGIVMGTIGYIAPERIKGGAADERVDIYSIGAILYEALTKKIPYETDSRVISVPTSSEDLVPVRSIRPDIPPHLEAICLKALAVNPEDRYSSAEEFRNALIAVRDRLAAEFQQESKPVFRAGELKF